MSADIIIGYAPPMRGTATRYYLAHVRTQHGADCLARAIDAEVEDTDHVNVGSKDTMQLVVAAVRDYGATVQVLA